MNDLIQECILQLEYLNEKFGATGTTNALLARLRATQETHYSLELSLESMSKISKLISEGWEVSIHWGEHTSWTNVPSPNWEVDFTRQRPDGRWDNHMSGYSVDVNEAVTIAYTNIRNGVKLKKQITEAEMQSFKDAMDAGLKNSLLYGVSAFHIDGGSIKSLPIDEALDVVEESERSPQDFSVYSYRLSDGEYVYKWWEGLKLVINKNGQIIELEDKEIKQLTKALPRTFGGTY